MQSSLQIAILAAGQGKRMRSALPKVLQPLGGRPLLAHVLSTARKLEPRAICVVDSGGEVRERFADPDLTWARQDPPRGTGDALKCALSELGADGVTLVMFGADPLARAETLRRVAERAQQGILSLLTVELDDPSGYGRIVRGADGKVAAIVEHKDATPEQRAIREINTGIMAAPTAAFARWLPRIGNRNAGGEYYLTDVIALAVADGIPVETTHPATADETLGINSKRDLAMLERIYQRGQADALLDAGVTLADPARIDVRGTLQCGRDVSIDVNCVFEGRVTLADNVTIGPNCVIRDAAIGAGTRVDAFTHIEGGTTGAHVVLGPYARLRPGAILGDDVHVGNFVEVKNAVFGQGSKANHLSYVGDSDVGARVNIGAGTITCNYDGANKHRTVIEDDVFVGSDSQLVAPVRVGRGVTIAAGTTVWKDVGEGELVLNEKTQVSKSGYVRPVKKKA